MSFLAVIYDPTKERQKNNLISDGWSPLKPPIYPFSCQIPENLELLSPTTQKSKNGGSSDTLFIQKYKSIFFRPSAILDVLKSDWEYAAKDIVVKYRVECGALTVIEPSKEALELEPEGQGYYMFSLPDALKLVAHTKDLNTLELWLEKEERNQVLEAGKKQHKAIESHIRALRES